MGILQRECENYVKDNADAFPNNSGKPRGAKFDYVENTIVEGKKQSKDALDSVQKSAAQELVIKRFRKIKKDIIRDDDEFSMDLLVR